MEVSNFLEKIEKAEGTEEKRYAIEDLIDSEQVDERVIDTLADYLKIDDSGLRDVCSRFFKYIDDDHKVYATKKIAELILETEITARNLAGDILISYGYTAVEHLLPYTGHHDMDVRKFALDIVGLNGTEAELDYIYQLIDDPDTNVRMSVFEAVGNICERLDPEDENELVYFRRTTDFLIENFAKEEDNQVFIVEALAKMGLPESEDFLIEILNKEEDFFLQIACIDALGLKCMRYDICEQLLEVIGNFNELVQPVILKTINAIAFRLGTPVELPHELRYIAHNALEDDNEDVKMSGIISLGKHVLPADVPYLANIYDSLEFEAQSYVIELLLVHSSDEVIDYFLNEYLQTAIVSSLINKDLDLLNVIIALSGEIDADRRKKIFDRIIEIAVVHAKGSSVEVVEYISEYDRETAINKLRCMINAGCSEDIAEVLELVLQLQLTELAEDTQKLAECGDDIILDKLGRINEMTTNGK